MAKVHTNNARQKIADLSGNVNSACQVQEEAESKARRQILVATIRLKHQLNKIAPYQRMVEAARLRKSPAGMSREDRILAADKLRH